MLGAEMFLRNFDANGGAIGDQQKLIYADYSPFMVAEFRDWLVKGRYDGDRSPASDDNGDGHTFNQDFKQSFKTWRLRYYDDSGPIRYRDYLELPEKLPESGPFWLSGGFDAPRTENPGDPFWQEWNEFRKQVITNWLRDYASWIRTTDPAAGFGIPSSRYYTHQIPADLIFGRRDTTRLGARNPTPGTATGRKTHFRDLRRLARPGFARENYDLVGLDRCRDFLGPRADGQLGRELETERKRLVGGRHGHEEA
jgi:hypothetical protein